MATKKRLIDVLPYVDTLESAIIKERMRFIGNPAMQAVIDLLGTAKNLALQQPTVDAVEVVHGRWVKQIEKDELFGDVKYYTCSECNWIDQPCYNYCPNCGAKMDLEVE